MKEFFKYVLATVVGITAFGALMFLFLMISLLGMVAANTQGTKIKDNSVLVIKQDGLLSEKTTSSFLNDLQGIESNGLAETLSAIRKAQKNDKIKGIYLEEGMMLADMAQRQELRAALQDFRKSGKWIIAYGDIYGQGSYYVASVANKIYLNPQGTIEWTGLGGESFYVKDALAKLGIKMISLKEGKYKSFVEMFTEDKMSEANREQTERYLNGSWGMLTKAVSESRGINMDSLNAYADRVISTEDASNMKKYKLVDGLLYDDEIKGVVKKQLGISNDEMINQVTVAQMNNSGNDETGEKIAIYYAEGNIVQSVPENGDFSNNQYIASDDVCKDLEKLADDDDVKAVVLRINSGGGSAYASEQMWHQIEMLKKKKPVVVSMSGMAASGGYYMSCNANWIVADPSTVTGSIGVFGVIPDVSELLTQKIGLKFDEVKTNRNSTLGAVGHSMTEEQTNLIRLSINRIYNLFKSRVAAGRKMSMEQVEALAQGHVYLGTDALKLKLVDELGGLDKAVAKAAKLAKLDEYYTEDYPTAKDWIEQFVSSTERAAGTRLDEELRLSLGQLYEPFMLMRTINTMDRVQARAPFIISNKK